MTRLPLEIRGADNKRIRGVGKGWKGTPTERFWRKVEYDHQTGCCVWVGGLCSSGYGTFLSETGARNAHRWLWERFEGAVPEGLQLDHLCRNRACVNLEHLEPVTGSENQLRGVNPALTRARAAARKACIHGHAFDDANTYIHGGYRHCRKCRAATERLRKARLRAAA